MRFYKAFFWKPGGFFLSQHQIKIYNFMREKTILNLFFSKANFQYLCNKYESR
jgi:hypothetical protein